MTSDVPPARSDSVRRRGQRSGSHEPDMTGAPDRAGEALNLSYLRHLVGNLSGLVHIRAREVFRERLTDLQLTPKQAVVLEFISNNQGVSQREIALGVVTTPAMLVSVLDLLAEQGLVERITDPGDRRRTFVRLTSAGGAVTRQIRDTFFQIEEQMRAEAGMTRAEWEMLIDLLRRITERNDDLPNVMG